jgi:cyclase
MKADEIVFLDISASLENRRTMLDVMKRAAKEVTIPLTVGGGIRNIDDIRDILNAGVDKISINSSAVKTPDLIKEASIRFGSQRIVVAIDAKKSQDGVFEVFINGGKVNTGLDAVEWAKTCESLGAGEILLTSMDKDGVKSGYDLELTRKVSEAVNIPVIASGGAGKKEDFYDVLSDKGKASAALAASLFHFNELEIGKLKQYLKSKGISVRI